MLQWTAVALFHGLLVLCAFFLCCKFIFLWKAKHFQKNFRSYFANLQIYNSRFALVKHKEYCIMTSGNPLGIRIIFLFVCQLWLSQIGETYFIWMQINCKTSWLLRHKWLLKYNFEKFWEKTDSLLSAQV